MILITIDSRKYVLYENIQQLKNAFKFQINLKKAALKKSSQLFREKKKITKLTQRKFPTSLFY